MDIWLFLSLSVVVGVCLSIYAYAIGCSKFNHIEESLNMVDFVELYLLRTAHFSVIVFFAFYVLFADISFEHDMTIISLTILICLHWGVFGGCILTILEKRILFPDGINYPEKMPFLALLNAPNVLTDIPDEFILIVVILLAGRILIAKNTILCQ